MNLKLFAFQRICVDDLRKKIAGAQLLFNQTGEPQVVSLQAPTGAGKTIIMSALLENIYCGTDAYAEQPEAIVVWLSDMPSLNEQSKKKIVTKANKINVNQCVTIDEASFDMEFLEDGKVYFLNTQKLSKSGKLSSKGDGRQYTIWETLENTVREKGNHLYFIIDEAHRGMKGTEAGKATTIMQRFIKGSPQYGLSPMPVVIGMSATADRFNKLVEGTSSTIHKIVIKTSDVRDSGLLKDRIIVKFPDDTSRFSEMAVLQGAAEEWKDKCDHWWQYCTEQHYEHVCPVFVIQVASGSGSNISDTNLDDVLAKIEEHLAYKFAEHEVVHTFGNVGDISANGLTVHHVEPDEIEDDKSIKIVFFKENLSTGWDCPRAETMISFAHANDETYIAQLLGRMIRTPRGSRISVDESLNNVYLFLPYFNRESVDIVTNALKEVEGGELPSDVEAEGMGESTYVSLTTHVTYHQFRESTAEGQMALFEPNQQDTINQDGVTYVNGENTGVTNTPSEHSTDNVVNSVTNTPSITTVSPARNHRVRHQQSNSQQLSLQEQIKRDAIIKFINSKAYIKHHVRKVKINSYIRSLMDLASLLTRYNIDSRATDYVHDDMVELVHDYINELKESHRYMDDIKKILEYKLSTRIYDAFGDSLDTLGVEKTTLYSSEDVDRQARQADAKLCCTDFTNIYGKKYYDEDTPLQFQIDCILFANNDDCIAKLNDYAKDKYHELCDQYRTTITNYSEECRKEYGEIVHDGDVVSEDVLWLPNDVQMKKTEGQEYFDHLYVEERTGSIKIKLNSWEEGTLKEEQERTDFVCWLRNPVREKWSLSIAYEMDNIPKAMYPDFIVVRQGIGDNPYVIDILEPHDSSRSDNLPKAKGLVKYARKENRIGRIQLIRETKDVAGNKKYKRLDMTKRLVQEKVLNAVNNEELDHIFDTDGYFEGN